MDAKPCIPRVYTVGSDYFVPPYKYKTNLGVWDTCTLVCVCVFFFSRFVTRIKQKKVCCHGVVRSCVLC